MFNLKTIAPFAGLVAMATAHMKITSPKPFDLTMDNSPLEKTGSNFPCKATSSSTFSGPVNSFALGSKQTLALIGTAVHGGGSCQISITYDTAPTAKSVWKVIHTIQGGCPARNTAGNLDGNDASLTDPFTYDYTIPEGIPTGNATIAWTWLNRIGNREFYMNCGRLELTGSGGDQSNFDSLPDMFVANIDSVNKCSTEGIEGMDPLIPNPGTSVEVNKNFDTAPFGTDCTNGLGSGSGSSNTATTAAAPAPATSITSTGGSASTPGGVFITQSTVETSAVPTTATTLQTSAVVTTAPAASATTGTGAGSASGAQTGACTTEGEFICLGSSYQQCGSGQWSVVMPLAAGTSCTPGESANLDIAAINKRSYRQFRA